MTSIGETLRRERLRLGLDLAHVADRTKIGTRLLQAMEADDFDKLPGGVFSRSFIKQYARILGLDEEAIAAEYKTIQQKNEESPPAPQGFRSQSDIASVVPVRGGFRISELHPHSRSMLVSAGWIVIAIGTGLAAYFFLNHSPSPAAASPNRVTKSEPAPVTPRKTEAAKQEAITPQPVTPEPVTPQPVTPEPVTTEAAASLAPASLVSAPASPVQVFLKATEQSWISVFADGRNKFTGILQPNESKQIDADERVKVTTGNSGGLYISLNGKSIGPIGPTGQRSTIELTAEGAHVVRRTSAESAEALPDPLL
ncbi:MAG: RodZ domain-containing protein [Bryobacteraceae bacterium]